MALVDCISILKLRHVFDADNCLCFAGFVGNNSAVFASCISMSIDSL